MGSIYIMVSLFQSVQSHHIKNGFHMFSGFYVEWIFFGINVDNGLINALFRELLWISMAQFEMSNHIDESHVHFCCGYTTTWAFSCTNSEWQASQLLSCYNVTLLT